MAIRKLSNSSIITGTKSSKFWDQETFPGYFESIATIIIGSAGQSTISFSNIPQNYAHLQLRGIARSNRSGASGDYLKMQFNGDTSSLYYDHVLIGDGSSASSSTSQAYYGTSTVAQVRLPVVHATTANQASAFGASVTDVLDYTNTNKFKVIRSFGGYDDNGAFLKSVERFNGNQWGFVAALSAARVQHTMVSFKGKLYVMGGDASDQLDVEVYTPSTGLGSWESGTDTTADLPVSRRYAAAVVLHY